MDYYFKYELKIKLILTDGVFAFITDAIKRHKDVRYLLRDGSYWNIAMKYRKYGEITTVTLEHLEKTILKAIGEIRTDYTVNQEAREFAIDLYNTLEKIHQDTLEELKLLNDPNFKYTSTIRFV